MQLKLVHISKAMFTDNSNCTNYVLQVTLDFPNEFLTSIHGYYGRTHEWGPVLIRSLTFKSNKKTYGPFGNEEGTSFSIPMSGGKIVGFYGKCGWFLDSIGAHIIPLQQQNPSKALVQTQNSIANGTDSFGFSVLQGSIGQNYDIILAVRQKDDFSSKGPLPNNKLSRQSSESSSDGDTNEKVRNLNIYVIFILSFMSSILLFNKMNFLGKHKNPEACFTKGSLQS